MTLSAPTSTDSPHHFTLRLPNYEGPLEVLLRLIEERHLDITAVSLAKVADQFMAYLSAMPRRDPTTMSHFLSVAARLIVIKSRALLPQFGPLTEEEQADADELVAQLRAYQTYKRLARWLRQREEAGLRAWPASAPPIVRPRPRQLPLDHVTLEALAHVMRRVVERWMPPPLADEVVAPLVFTVNDRIARIESALTASSRITFSELLRDARTRAEVIVTLLALLELLKRYVVRARQDALFGEILIEPLPPEERPSFGEEGNGQQPAGHDVAQSDGSVVE
ncbi:MAG: ScpA family protein [Anaerolineae bacterium]|nr:segregation/condensation protein A [Thermoflexales bacterium]MDW8407411.1 ScpA family protein [Anaerolineae bacterium]